MRLIIFAILTVLLVFAPAAQADFVQKSGSGLTLGRQPYKFTGFNDYQLMGCGYTANFDSDITAMGPGKEVVRTWFFQNSVTNPDGTRNWAKFDAAIATAKARGIKLLPALINQWKDCETWTTQADAYKPPSWYTTLYRYLPTSPGMPKTYEGWVDEVTFHYRNEDTILGWQMVNEAEAADSYGGPCSSSTATAALKSFATNIASHIHTADPNHLVMLGVLGSGQCGTAGSAFQDVHSAPGIDVVSIHDYNNAIIGGDAFNGIQKRIDQTAALGKPLIVDESGIRIDWTGIGNQTNRANLLNQKISTMFTKGISGFLYWTWRDAAHGGSSTTGLEVGPNDQALPVLGAY